MGENPLAGMRPLPVTNRRSRECCSGSPKLRSQTRPEPIDYMAIIGITFTILGVPPPVVEVNAWMSSYQQSQLLFVEQFGNSSWNKLMESLKKLLKLNF